MSYKRLWRFLKWPPLILCFILTIGCKDFDEKKINMVFLFVIGRSGSLLLQSLLDNHEEVIMLPSYFPVYYEWDKFTHLTNNKKAFIH